MSSPYHPQTQGAVERSHQNLKRNLRKYTQQYQSSWNTDLLYILFVLRDAPNETTGVLP